MTISEIIRDILDKQDIDNIFFVACGGSLAACWPAKYFLETEAKGLRTMLVTSNEFVHATPVSCGARSIVVACSLRGTAETAQALRTAAARGAATVAFTGDAAYLGDPDYALARAGRYLVTYRNADGLSCREGNMVKLFSFAVELLHGLEGYAGYDDMQRALERLDGVLARSVELATPDAKAFAAAYADRDTIYVMGSGPAYGAAYAFSICSLMEISWIHSPTIHTGEYFHGPFETTLPGTAVLLLKCDGPTRPLDVRAERFLQQHCGHQQVLDAGRLAMDGIPEPVRDYFNGIVLNRVLASYLEELARVRRHDRSVRRYLRQVAY